MRRRAALAGLLLATAGLYLWRLGDSGWANPYYSAAAQAGSRSWTAFFFGAFDEPGSVTVDKPPAFLWPMALSVRLFGLNAWSILVPQALAGVAAVGTLYATVRRWYGTAAGLIAGAALALTPVATLMFRFNNPDALLVLLLVLAGYATVRATESATTGWLVAAGALLGAGFLTKLGQAMLVVPAYAAVYLLAAPTALARRCWQVGAAGAAMLAAAGWYVAIVELAPSRPVVGGSPTNSLLELALGYNGLGRLAGGQLAGAGGTTPGVGSSGPTRLFDLLGDQIAWLLPAAAILLVAGLALTWQRPRTDRERAGFLLWGGWLVVTGLVFSLMRGIIHAYYTVALAPAIAALVGMGAVLLWRHRHRRIATVVLAVAMADTAWWSASLLGRHPQWHPWLRFVVLAGGLAVAVLLLLLARLPAPARRAVAIGGLAVALAAPLAYSITTAAAPHRGYEPVAGPVPAPPAPAPRPNLAAMLQAGDHRWAAATVGAGTAAELQLATGRPVMPIGGFIGLDPTPSLARFQEYVRMGLVHYLVAAPGPVGHEITAWVAALYFPIAVDGLVVYDLSSPAASAPPGSLSPGPAG
jgi:4-amino-4-deoxy-L-arabinose transferase-like glycosyltransferase